MSAKYNEIVDETQECINSHIKNKGGRPSKDSQYIEERKQVLNKILNIIGITEDNTVFYFDDIEKNPDKIKQILDLESDVRKYFNCSGWTYFTQKPKKPYISLMKSVFKTMNVKMTRTYQINGETKKFNKRGLQLY